MGKPIDLGSERANAMALDLSERLDKPLDVVILEALAAFDAAQPKAVPRNDEHRMTKHELLYGPLLKRAQEAVKRSKSTFEIEDLYDPETGLPW